jgi:hypothetical protein
MGGRSLARSQGKGRLRATNNTPHTQRLNIAQLFLFTTNMISLNISVTLFKLIYSAQLKFNFQLFE